MNEKSKLPLYCWEIIKLIKDQENETKKLRTSEIVAARKISQVLEHLALDIADEGVEIESIVRFGPIVSILEDKEKQCENSKEQTSNP